MRGHSVTSIDPFAPVVASSRIALPPKLSDGDLETNLIAVIKEKGSDGFSQAIELISTYGNMRQVDDSQLNKAYYTIGLIAILKGEKGYSDFAIGAMDECREQQKLIQYEQQDKDLVKMYIRTDISISGPLKKYLLSL
jgi:hypothetical protein